MENYDETTAMLSCVEIMVCQSFLFFQSYDLRDGFLTSVYSTLHLFQLNPKIRCSMLSIGPTYDSLQVDKKGTLRVSSQWFRFF